MFLDMMTVLHAENCFSPRTKHFLNQHEAYLNTKDKFD